jgi:hypothetical protein
MIAKNVGIRRARGRFVLATNIDIIFSTELIDYLATRRLEAGRLYRVDRHDIQPDVPLDPPLEAQMAYCQSHQLRVHTRWGSYPVDAVGRHTRVANDIVDGRTVRLGRGWHILEGDDAAPRYRWASEVVELFVDTEAHALAGGPVLDIEIESNPYDPLAWVDLVALDGERRLVQQRVAGQGRLVVPIDAIGSSHQRTIGLRVIDSHPDSRLSLPAFERRDALHYRVVSARLRLSTSADRDRHEDPITASASPRLPVRRGWRGWAGRMAHGASRALSAAMGHRLRYLLVRETPEFKAVEQALRASDEQLRALAQLRYLGDFEAFLRDRRPDNLHVNACGDFQLLSREHWDQLCAYPEFETFSMNIDGLFSYIADASGIREEVLPMPIYHLEHEVGSGWSPEGEAMLRRRIAERGITWLDASTVYIWAAYMRWLGRPMIFNGADWGLTNAAVTERSTAAPSGVTS